MNNMAIKKLTAFLVLTLPLITACSGLLSKQSVQIGYYSLESSQLNAPAESQSSSNNALPTLIINTPKAAAGFDTRHMMYTRAPHKLEYFARNEWVDTPANMLQPLMIATIANTGNFSAVIPKLGAVKADLRLESEVLKLVQAFDQKPSVVYFSLRAVMINNATGKIVALREFKEQAIAKSDDPNGGVNAANVAVDAALKKLSAFSAETTINWNATNSNTAILK